MIINKKWDKILDETLGSNEFCEVINKVKEAYNGGVVYPEYDKIFEVYNLVDIDDIKVVILGQDPYHTRDMANGLAFSVYNHCDKMPPSLRNIFKEINNEMGINNINKDLTPWAKQGVFLLNTTLTVEEGKANSHRKYGWDILTTKTIEKISENNFVIFLLWGNFAQNYKKYIDNRHMIIETSHPSPFSARKSFFGSNQFNKVNEILEEKGMVKIDWRT